MPLSCFLAFPWVLREIAASARMKIKQSMTQSNKSYTSARKICAGINKFHELVLDFT